MTTNGRDELTRVSSMRRGCLIALVVCIPFWIGFGYLMLELCR